MEITSTTLFLVGVICVVLGFFASVLLNTLREEGIEPAEDGIQAPPGGRKGRYVPIARLWREKKTGVLVVEMDGVSLVSGASLEDENRARLEQAARDFRSWLGIGMAGQAAGEASAASGSPEVVAAAVSAAPASLSAAPAARPQVVPVAPLRKPVVPSPAAVPAAAIGTKSIVMQIDDILQEVISNGPLAHRSIRLSEDHTLGVMVTVDSEVYEGIDSVPDPEVKAALRDAVKRWEKSQ